MKLAIHLLTRSAVVLLLVVATSGCANLRALRRAGEIESRMKRELAKLYDKQGYNYFLLGYGYYTLAKEAEDAGAPALRVKDYRAKARLYYLYSQDMQEAADQLRSDEELRSDDQLRSGPRAEAEWRAGSGPADPGILPAPGLRGPAESLEEPPPVLR